MRTMHTLAILAALIATPAFSQTSPGQWVDDLYFVSNTAKDGKNSYFYRGAFIDEKNNIHSTIPSLSEAEDFPVHRNYLTFGPKRFWYDEALYALASDGNAAYKEKDKDNNLFQRFTFAKWLDNKWEFLGTYKYLLYPGSEDYEGDLRALPCDNDRFIVVSRFRDLAREKGEATSPFARMSIRSSSKDAVVDSSIYHGIYELKYYMSDQKFFGLACNAIFIVTGKYATIINEVTGLYWCFSLKKATLTKAGCIFKGIRPEEILKTIAKGGITMAVLCANPEKDGTVLVSASEEAALRGEVRDKWDEIREMMEENPKMSETEAEKLFLKHQEALAKRNPWVVWYRIYPENGRVEKLSQPPIGGADKKKSTLANLMSLGTANDWRPMPDDSVVMGELKLKEPKQTESEPKKKESDSARPLFRGYY
jgi:hypothetical protein